MNVRPLTLLIAGILWSIYSIVVGVAGWRLATSTIPIDQLPIVRIVAPHSLPLLFLVPFVYPRKFVLVLALIIGAVPFYHLLRYEWIFQGTIWGMGTAVLSILLVGFSGLRVRRSSDEEK